MTDNASERHGAVPLIAQHGTDATPLGIEEIPVLRALHQRLISRFARLCRLHRREPPCWESWLFPSKDWNRLAFMDSADPTSKQYLADAPPSHSEFQYRHPHSGRENFLIGSEWDVNLH